MLSKYGYDIVGTVVALALLGSIFAWFFVDARFVRYGLIALLLLFLLFTLYFFRDPDRTTPAGDGLVIAPADGEIVLLKPIREDE